MKQNSLFTPPFLKPGDKIGLVAPARKISENEILPVIKKIENIGYKVITGKNLFGEHHQFSGTDQERAADFQQMLDNKEIKVILCARGGYGSVRIVNALNFNRFKRYPKWIAGFSDITVFHSYINKLMRCETLHCAMPVNFTQENSGKSFEMMIQTLEGKIPDYAFRSNPLNKSGETTGQFTGGNLSMIYSLRGTPLDIDTRDKILFIEDIDEYLYHIDRMMMNLKTGNLLKNLSGLLCGAMTDMKDNTIPYGQHAFEIIHHVVDTYTFPYGFDFPAGHIDDNFPLIMGRKARLKITPDACSLTFMQP